MIGKQTKGRSFRGLLNYLESREKAFIIGGNMSGRGARELAREFRLSRQLNGDVQRAVYHVSLSLPPHERLDDDTWNEIAQKYLSGMGFTANQYVVYRHCNTDNDHIHIAASRIRLDDGSCVHDGWDYKRSEAVIRQLERDYGLEAVQSSSLKLRRDVSSSQRERIERERAELELGQRFSPPQKPVKQQLQSLIDDATIDHPTMPLLIERLQVQGVEVRHGFTRTGKSKGISYGFQGQHFSGSQLGAAYTFPGLQKHQGVDYCPERDDRRIEQLLKYPAPATTNKTFAPWDNQPTIPEPTATTARNERTFAPWDNQPTVPNVDTTPADIGSIAPPSKEPIIATSTTQSPFEASRTIALPHNQPPLTSTTGKEAVEANCAELPHQDEDKWRHMYQRNSTGLEHLSLDERDKQIVKNLLLRKSQLEEIRDIILASPVKRTREQTKQLVIEALTEFVELQERYFQQEKSRQSQLER